MSFAQNLEIKEIGKNVVEEEEASECVDDNQSFEQEVPVESDEIQSNESSRPTNQDINIDSSDTWIPGNKQKHENIKYACQQCDHQAASKPAFKYHVESKHTGLKYPCQKCDYQATAHSHLQQHIKSKHEGFKYPCQQCDYQATKTTNLQRHIKYKHEGI